MSYSEYIVGYDQGYCCARARGWVNFLIAAGLAFTVLVGVLAYQSIPASPKAAPLASSTVFIDIGGHGHCSGVYLGNDLVLTAAHCSGQDDKEDLTVSTDMNDKYRGERLWVSKTADLMLLSVKFIQEPQASHLACRKPIVGEEVNASGNPYGETFLTTKGYVAGSDRLSSDVLTTPLSITILPGMSGGPAFDKDGDVIGINDQVLVAPVNPMVGTVPLGIGFMVPSYVACELMGEGRA